MKLLLTLSAAICLVVTASALGQNTDTSAVDHSHCQKMGEADSPHEHNQGMSHFMVMVGAGTPGANSVFRTVGAGFEYRLPGWGGIWGVGVTGMAMIFNDYTHFMFVGTGTVRPLGDLFFQGETGLTHAHTPGVSNPHQMALLGGLGAGYHCHLAHFTIAPMINIEYSRLQKPTYSFMVCLGV